MRVAHPDATPGTPRSCGPNQDPTHSRTRTGAALSVGVLAAALAALAAPSVASRAPTPVALSAADTPVAVQPVTSAAQDRLEAMERTARSSRSADRGELPTDDADVEIRSGEEVRADLPVAEPEPDVVGTRYATTELNVRTKSDMDSKVVTTLDLGDKVKITEVTEDEWRQVVYKDETRWVKKEFLSKSKPDPKPAGPSSAACASGSGVEGGLAANTIAVHRAVCNAFPSVANYGGRRGSGGNHGSGHALDIMVSGSAGDAIADYVRKHASELGVSEVIWSQHIWTVQRGGEGWRGMSDRGSATANHYDHVHVSTF